MLEQAVVGMECNDDVFSDGASGSDNGAATVASDGGHVWFGDFLVGGGVVEMLILILAGGPSGGEMVVL